MPAVSFTAFRRNLAKHLDDVERDQAELVVTRRNRESLVVVPLNWFGGWRETIFLMAGPANAEHLRQSIAELDAGKGAERKQVDV